MFAKAATLLRISFPRPARLWLRIGAVAPADCSVDVCTFEPGDTLLLYTDGVAEARDRSDNFYPLAERAAQWTGTGPDELLQHIRRDLLAHVGGRLADDAALIALHRTPTVHRGRPRIFHLGRGGPDADGEPPPQA
ncbi:PP2C family protein-serine/threonine phosphatase [Kitasatospora sp. NPDC059673]|uniref:PP2C family protein-serine/threonine phosphatase n=1 Tax=Kitasatospora sp. NPDC059673 TaxID=3346901 RepID=UPI0036A2D82A